VRTTHTEREQGFSHVSPVFLCMQGGTSALQASGQSVRRRDGRGGPDCHSEAQLLATVAPETQREAGDVRYHAAVSALSCAPKRLHAPLAYTCPEPSAAQTTTAAATVGTTVVPVQVVELQQMSVNAPASIDDIEISGPLSGGRDGARAS